MMNQNKRIALFSCSFLAFAAIGCGGGESEKKIDEPVVQQRPSTAPKPKTRPVDKIASSLSIDDRVYLAENEAPRSEKERIALLQFFDAMLNSDQSKLQSMLAFEDQMELGAMIKSGLEESMENVSLLVLKTGESPEGRKCALAVYEVGMDYQVQMWFYDVSGNSTSFSAVATPPNLVHHLSGNWVTNYFELRDKQAEIAQQPDEETSYTLAGDLTSSGNNNGGSSEPSAPGGPGRPGGPIGR